MKKNYAQRMETKNWFLEALLDLIDEKDYGKITVTDIAKKAGVYYKGIISLSELFAVLSF